MNEEKFEGKLKSVLTKYGFYALEDWGRPLVLRHNGIEGRKEAFKRINKAIKSLSVKGIYRYEKEGVCLYVGHGYLRQRLQMHYDESLPESGFKGVGKRSHEFFGNPENQGELRIFWKEVDDDSKAEVIERMLIYLLKPKFEDSDRYQADQQTSSMLPN